jgi:hypothetical protein
MHMHKEHKCATSAQKSCKPVFVHLPSVSCGLKNYIDSKHLGILKMFECNTCDFSAKNKGAMKQHEHLKHKKTL